MVREAVLPRFCSSLWRLIGLGGDIPDPLLTLEVADIVSAFLMPFSVDK
jgi:hypothetical protein